MENKPQCATCSMRAKYDNNAKSLGGRFWRWHINFCPGWKAYFSALSPDEQSAIREKYKFEKYRKKHEDSNIKR